MKAQLAANGAALEEICRGFDIQILYAFGSRASEVYDWLSLAGGTLLPGKSDVDIGAKPAAPLPVRSKAELAVALEDLLGVGRVDLVIIPEADPFLAANVIRGQRLYCQDRFLADEYDLYILRRAGDLAFLERERQRLVFGGCS